MTLPDTTAPVPSAAMEASVVGLSAEDRSVNTTEPDTPSASNVQLFETESIPARFVLVTVLTPGGPPALLTVILLNVVETEP